MILRNSILLALVCSALISCKKRNSNVSEFDDSAYVLTIRNNALPNPMIPMDNPLTVTKVALGKALFYDKLLSSDQTVSCASCHFQEDAFSDANQFSTGVNGAQGDRQGMPIFNLAFHRSGFFWDGRAERLRDQALGPIENPLEMNETLDNVIAKLSQEDSYKEHFLRAFGSEEVTSERIALALENFMFTIISDDSKYDRVRAGQGQYTASEARGRNIYFGNFNPNDLQNSGGDCVRCHGGPNLDRNGFINAGVDTDASMTDLGRANVTNNPNDRGKFKVPSLRNIAVSGPYMHDGRFETLLEVIDHYNSGIQESTTLDPGLRATRTTGLGLDAQDKQDLINFLNTLTDQRFLTNDDYSDPN